MVESEHIRPLWVGGILWLVVFAAGAASAAEPSGGASESKTGSSQSSEEGSAESSASKGSEGKQASEDESIDYMTIEEAERRRKQNEQKGVDQIILRGHFIGLQFDVGTRYAAGLGYSWAGSTRTVRREGPSTARWWAVGPHVRTHTADFETFDAFSLGAHGRLILASTGGLGFEAQVNLARTSSRFQGTGHAGVFWPIWHVLEVGYSYQVPLGPFERPEWLSSHQFSVRSNLPLHQWRTDDGASED